MSTYTDIQWCDSTVNPVMGCSGCELWNEGRKTCYAGHLHQRRRGNPGFAPDFSSPTLYPGRMQKAAGLGDRTGHRRPEKPWLDGLPRLIFVSDMGDALSEHGALDAAKESIPGGAVPFDFLKAEIIDTALSSQGQRHRWLWLTKRPGRMAEFCTWLKQDHGLAWPPNVWAGTSVTRPASLPRVAQLAKVGDDRTVRFVSAEPLWREVSLADHLRGVSWVIVGGESTQGQPAEAFRCEWARSLRDECRQAKVAFFLKQLGANASDGEGRLRLRDSHGGDWDEWPEDLRVRELPIQGAAGPMRRSLVVLTELPETKPPAEGPGAGSCREPFTLLSAIEPRPVEWLWQVVIPLGELTLVDGDPGTNKSSVTLDLAARVSTGREMPDGTPGLAGTVLLIAGEDSIPKTLRQRLQAAGADLNKVAVPGRDVIIPEDLNVVKEAAVKLGAKLIVIDPLVLFLGRNANSEQSVRQALKPLQEFAAQRNVAVVMVRHLNKSGGRQALYRGSGSIAIVAATRSALLIGKDPRDENRRVLCHMKSNLGPLAPSLLFEPVMGDGGMKIEWRGECDYEAEDLLTRSKEGSAGSRRAEAESFLLELLADGPVAQKEVQAKAAAAGFAMRTVERAKDALGVRSQRRGFGPGSICLWELAGVGRDNGD